MTQLLARPFKQTKHKSDAVKEIISRIHITTLSHNSILQSPYLSRETIQSDPKYSKDKIRKMLDHESTPKSSYRVKPNTIEGDSRPTRKIKQHTVLTLPPSTHLPPSCKYCHDLELCKCRHNNEIKHDNKRHRTAIGGKITAADSERDRYSFIEEYKTGENISERRNALRNGKSITSLKTPTYVISRIMTPERDLSVHDIWNILREINTKHYVRTAQQISAERLLYDAKSKRRNAEQNPTVESRRREGKDQLLAFYNKNAKENALSYGSSLEYVPAKDVNEGQHGVVRVRNKNMCVIDSKHVNRSSHRTENPMSTRNRQHITTNSTTSKETGMQTLSGIYSSTPDRKDIQREKSVSTVTRPWNQHVITPKINITNVNYEKVSQTHKNLSAPIAFNKKIHIRKITYSEMKRQLAVLRYPIVLMGRDICASVNVPEYQAPQFENMKGIWQYMTGWSTNYNEDNIKSNKYLKLIEKQEDKESRLYKGFPKNGNGKRQRIQKTIVRNNNIPKNNNNLFNIINSDVNTGLEDKEFKVLFQNINNIDPKIAQEITRQPTKNRDTAQVPLNTINIFEKTETKRKRANKTQLNERNASPDMQTLVQTFVENLTIKNKEDELDPIENIINENKERLPARKYSNKLTKSKEDIRVKVKATLNKLGTDYFYDYNSWIENTLSQSSSRVRRHPFRQSSIFSNRKKTLDQPERKEPTSKGSPSEIETFRIPSLTKSNTKSLTRKSRNKIVQKYFMDPFLSLPEPNDLTVETLDNNTSTPELICTEEVLKDIKTMINIPGFNEKPHQIVIRTLNGNELVVEDILNNIVVTFEVVNAFQESTSQSHQLNLNNPNINKMLSLNNTSKGPTLHYNASVELCSMTLPEQICSIWPLLLNKFDCIDDVLSELQNNTTTLKETIKEIPIKIVPKINMLEVYLHANMLNNFEKQNKGIPQLYDCSETKSILRDMQIMNFPEMFDCLSPTLQSMNVMETSSSLREMGSPKTLTIKYDLCSENQWNSNQNLRDYVSEEFTHVFNKLSRTKKTQNSLIRLHQDNTPIITFSISVQVMQKFLKLISNGRFQFLCMYLRSERSNTVGMSIHEKIASDIKDNTVDVDRPHLVKKRSSATKLKNVFYKLPGKMKNDWKRKCTLVENFKQSTVVKIRANRKDTKETNSGNIKAHGVNSMKDFMMVLGSSNEVLSDVINGQLAKRILTDLREYKIWSEEISPVQAILTLLLSSKPDTRSLVKFRPALVHGIATGRIRCSAELDQECLLVEQDADVDYTAMEVEDGKIVQELYSIAKKAASAHNRIFSEDTERSIDFLVKRKRKLNPSYMRVMAKYVGLGLFTSPV